ncbi:MAG TPA: hypothetical protein PLV93_12635 [Microthrixaceae bacterium]|nr:hypothetical protein [Microthrixaceae bacterium]
MSVLLGNAAISLGLAACVVGIGALLSGLRSGKEKLLLWARPMSTLALVAALGAVGVMQVALLTNDTSVKYVAEEGSKTTPFPFDVATMWSALEGSILLWALILAGFTVAVAHKFRPRLDDPLVGWAMLVMFVVSVAMKRSPR